MQIGALAEKFLTSSIYGAYSSSAALLFLKLNYINPPYDIDILSTNVLSSAFQAVFYAVFSIVSAFPAYVLGFLITLEFMRLQITSRIVWLGSGTMAAGLTGFAVFGPHLSMLILYGGGGFATALILRFRLFCEE